jgi:hypothetical protein
LKSPDEVGGTTSGRLMVATRATWSTGVEQGIESARDVANALGVNGPPHGNLHFGEGASLLRLMKTR